MPKNIDGVSLPGKRKSIRNIPIPESRRTKVNLDGVKKSFNQEKVVEVEVDNVVPQSVPPRPRNNSRVPKKIWYASAIGVLVLVFAVLSIFQGATLTYTPKSVPINFAQETFSANKSAGVGLVYSVVKLSGEKSISLPANGEAAVSRKASGTIVVYNDYSSQPQNLVENTRFEGSNGKIYRIAKSISIPGKTSAGPGSIEVMVYADEPGQESNLGLSDFTVPGLKGTPRYESIYARGKTSMTGGFVGKEKVVDQAELAKAKADLELQLKQELVAKAQSEVPTEFILYPSMTSIAYEDLPQTAGSESGTVSVNIKGNLVGIMFKRSEFVNTIATGKATITPRDQLDIDTLDSLDVGLVSNVDLVNAEKLDFKVAGSGNLIWKTDEAAFKVAVAGREEDEVEQIMKNFPTIESVSSSLRPFWKSSFPTDVTKIVVRKIKP